MGTMFEPSLSTSTMRAPLSTPAPSMADTLPSINFGFDELRDRMAKFTQKFDHFIAEGRKRVLEERNQFRMNVTELQGKQRTPAKEETSIINQGNLLTIVRGIEDQKGTHRSIQILLSKRSIHTSLLAREAAETNEMRAAITSLQTQHDTRAAHRQKLLTEISSVQKSIAAKLDAQAQYTASVAKQARLNGPELDFWERVLGLRIEGAGEDDKLKFVFTCICEREWGREAWCILDTSRREYVVEHWKPKVEKEMVEGVVERLNETRDIGAFLKGVRGLFVEALK
ncbi:MAG: kinetochore-associated Ndc80 complex subunit spc25 [Icmadophila ericetorum]|nr:kinetochore-associated Ndc80 complex subunit spc25 [Icmadophila ericetorum]